MPSFKSPSSMRLAPVGRGSPRGEENFCELRCFAGLRLGAVRTSATLSRSIGGSKTQLTRIDLWNRAAGSRGQVRSPRSEVGGRRSEVGGRRYSCTATAPVATSPAGDAILAGDTPAATGGRYFGQAAFSFAATEAYSSGESFLLGAGVPGGPSPKKGTT